MDNLFLAKEAVFQKDSNFEIVGQEAHHIYKVLRKEVGEFIYVANGLGYHSLCLIQEISKNSVLLKVSEIQFLEPPAHKKILALGAIKKKDRLEFAIEKSVELGVTELCVFNAERSERTRLNVDRINLVIESAFKQSKRYWLPKLIVLNSLQDVYMNYPDSEKIMAFEDSELTLRATSLNADSNLFLIGPEGGFSPTEVELHSSIKGEFISLGRNRLRSETAVTAILSQFLFSE